MFTRLVRAAAPFALLLAAPAIGQVIDPAVTTGDLRRHIDQLASDAFQGRAPSTEGERLTTAYITEQLGQRGVEPAGENGTWFQPVALVERVPRSSPKLGEPMVAQENTGVDLSEFLNHGSVEFAQPHYFPASREGR